MIWAFEYLNESQLSDLKRISPLMDFKYNFKKREFLWTTFCAAYEAIYHDPSIVLDYRDLKAIYREIPLDQVDLYPNDETCVDNVPCVRDSYEDIIDDVRSGEFNWSAFHHIKVVPSGDRYLTIDKSRVRAFRDAVSMGHSDFKTIPARMVSSLDKQIRRIRFFEIEQVRQGFICDDWEEAVGLSMYLSSDDTTIEKNYKWLSDYLAARDKNVWLEIIAIPVSIFLEHYANNTDALEMIDLNKLMGWR